MRSRNLSTLKARLERREIERRAGDVELLDLPEADEPAEPVGHWGIDADDSDHGPYDAEAADIVTIDRADIASRPARAGAVALRVGSFFGLLLLGAMAGWGGLTALVVALVGTSLIIRWTGT